MTTSRQNRTLKFLLAEPTDYAAHAAVCDKTGDLFHGGNMFFLGGRYKNYRFSSNKALLKRTGRKIAKGKFNLPEVPSNPHQAAVEALRPLSGFSFPQPKTFSLVAPAPSPKEPSALRRGAQGLALDMTKTMFTSAVGQIFDEDYLFTTRDRELWPEETREIADSLSSQIVPLRDQVSEVLPQVMQQLKDKNPKASTGQLYQGALQLIGQELMPILSTLQLWTTGMRQWLNPALNLQLRVLRAKIEQKLWLVLTGNLRLDLINDPAEIKQQIETIKVAVGDVIIPVLSDPFGSGPAVIPMVTGAVGPRGGHLMFYPANLLSCIATTDAIYDHEVGHLLMGIIVDFAKEYAQMIKDGIDADYKAGKIKFSAEFVMLGTQKIPSLDFLKMVFLNQIGELIADLFGCLIGGAPAFGSCFATYIGAMTSMALGGLDGVDHILRNGSSYTIKMKDGRTAVVHLEPHPQDNVRCGNWQADIADNTDFPKTAAWLRNLAATESGNPVPLYIVWNGEMPEAGDDDGGGDQQGVRKGGRKSKQAPKKSKSKTNPKAKPAPQSDQPEDDEAPGAGKGSQPQLPVIQQLVTDFAQGSHSLAEYLLETPARCLANEHFPSGMSLKQLVCLTPDMQTEKIDPLKELQKKGIGKIPQNGRHYFFHHVGSAATLAYDELVAEGMEPSEALAIVNKAGFEQMVELLGPWEELVKKLDIYNLKSSKVQPTK